MQSSRIRPLLGFLTSAAVVLLGVAVLTVLPPVAAETADPADQHCSNFPAASWRTPGDPVDRPTTTHTPFLVGLNLLPVRPELFIPNHVPYGPEWRVLMRPGQPFAVFYTEAATATDVLQDVDPSTGTLSNEDGDGVPDLPRSSATASV